MSSEIITELDSSFSNSRVDVQYPYIEVQATNVSPLPIVIGLLEEGSLPVLYEQNGTTYELCKISKAVTNLVRLLEVYPFKVVTSATQSMDVIDTLSLMEASRWMRQ